MTAQAPVRPARRWVFVGASGFGLRCLQAMERMADIDVVGAVTAPARFAISYRPQGVENVLHADIATYCSSRGIPSVTLAGTMSDPALFARVEAWRPDAMLVAGWYHMVPRKWRELARAYGLHASLLPDYSGGAPLVWAIINGEKRTGITLFQLAGGVDDGPIVGQAETPIGPDDTIATLYARIEELGIGLVERHVPLLAQGRAELTPQDESRRRLVPQRSPEDGRIDWSQPVSRIVDFVRAQTKPYPGAFAEVDGRALTLWTAHPSAADGLHAGEHRQVRDEHWFGCGDGRALVATDVEWRDG